MARVSLNQLTTFRWDFEKDVQACARSGDGLALGLWRPKLADAGLERSVSLSESAGVSISHVASAGGFTCAGWTFQEALDDAIDAIETAAQFCAPCVLIHSGPPRRHTRNHARHLLIEALREIASSADELGVKLAIEPQHRRCNGAVTWIQSVDDFLRLRDAVGADSMGLVFDTYHLGRDQEAIRRIPQLAADTSLVQIADLADLPSGENGRLLPGDGELPLDEIIHAFLEAGYDGYFDLELFGAAMDDVAYERRVEAAIALAETISHHREVGATDEHV